MNLKPLVKKQTSSSRLGHKGLMNISIVDLPVFKHEYQYNSSIQVGRLYENPWKAKKGKARKLTCYEPYHAE